MLKQLYNVKLTKTMKLKKIFSLASILSRFINKSTTQKKHVAAVIENGKLHCVRPNNPGVHAEYLSYISYYNCSKCTKNLKNKRNCKILIVIRYENGIFKNSKPCKECIEKLKYFVKKIVYSTGDPLRPFVCEKLDNLQNTWQSNLVRKFQDRVYSK
jgi:late competence protein required for DNA uptake (superfamily II DNA/RNA helicase)